MATKIIEMCNPNNLVYTLLTDYIRYWLGSIHTYSSKEAPVILVASHAESNRADPKKVRKLKTHKSSVY